MKITKFGHSCFLIEDNGTRALFDPGDYSTLQNSVKNLDILIITHSHSDHYDPESVTKIMKNNSAAEIVTNTEISGLLKDSGYKINIVEDGESITIKGMEIRAIGNEHREIYAGIDTPQCTGYLINNKLFDAADNFYPLDFRPEIILFAKFAPWLKISEVFDYLKSVKPKIAIPAHDGIVAKTDYVNGPFKMVLNSMGIDYMPLEIGKEYDL